MPNRIKFAIVPFVFDRPGVGTREVVRRAGTFDIGTGEGMIDPDLAAAAIAAGHAVPVTPQRSTRTRSNRTYGVTKKPGEDEVS